MKKISILIILILVLSMLAVSALAAQSATMSVLVSKNTVYRGDTVTVTVSASKVDNCTSGGFMFSYDTNVFEYVSGSATLSGYTSGISTAAGNVAGYFMNGNATVQGGIFRITLKVKDDAAFGSYTISGVPNMTAEDGAVSCGAGGATVTVSCNHNYDDWSKVDDTNHGKTCSICQNVQKEAHKWDNGTTIKQVTCKEDGQIKLTCTTCSATETIYIAKTDDHTYGNWAKVNDTTHKHTCTVCSKEETASHTWNSGTVTKKATCKEEGVMVYTCTACNATKTESIAKLTTHTYDHACDTDCNVCGVTRTTTHNYKTSWSKDKTNHWHECSVCKCKKDIAAHTPGAEATETKAQTCTICGYVIKAALGHKHNYATTWTTDDAGHWYACSGCEEKGSYVAHDFENACDKDCSICGYTRETEHKFDETWTTDVNNHWHVCSGCGLKQDESVHEPGAEATATAAQTCIICGYEITPAFGEPEAPAEKTTEPTETTYPIQASPGESGNFPWWIIIVIAVVAVGGVVTAVMIKKKKK